jgi:hypothetical protein
MASCVESDNKRFDIFDPILDQDYVWRAYVDAG